MGQSRLVAARIIPAGKGSFAALAVAFVALVALSGCSLLSTADQADAPRAGPLDGDVEQAMSALEDCQASPELEATAVVWLDLDVSADQVDEIATALSLLPSVTTVQYVGAEETYRAFVEEFRDEPEVIELVDPVDLPTSFELEVTSSDFVASEGPALMELAGVNDVEAERSPNSCSDQQAALAQACQSSGFEAWPNMLWILVPADRPDDPAEIEAVLANRALTNGAVSEDLTYRSSDEVLAEIVGYRDDLPELNLDGSPAAYTLVVPSQADAGEVKALIGDLQSLDWVEGAAFGWNSTTDICTASAATACEADPSLGDQPELRIWMEPGVDQPQVQAVSEKLDSVGAGADYRYVDKDQTYAEFLEYFAYDPNLQDLVGPEDLPSSFQVLVEPETLGRTLDDPEAEANDLFGSMDGVDDVRFLPCAAEIAALTDQCRASFPGASQVRPAAIQQQCS